MYALRGRCSEVDRWLHLAIIDPAGFCEVVKFLVLFGCVVMLGRWSIVLLLSLRGGARRLPGADSH